MITIKKHKDFLLENKQFSSTEEYLASLGLVQREDGKWNHDKGLKTIVFKTQDRDLIVENGKLKVEFGILDSAFKMVAFNVKQDLKLTSLEGLPEKAEEVDLSGNNLTSLQGIGEYRSYDLSDNELKNLEGLPNKIQEDLFVNKNQLTSLQGCPNHIDGILDVSYNKLTDLQGFPEKVSNAYIHENDLKTLYGIKRIDRSIPLDEESVKRVSKKELTFLKHKILNKEYQIDDYVLELIEFVKKTYGAEKIADLNIPENEIKRLTEEDKNIYISSKRLKKFNM